VGRQGVNVQKWPRFSDTVAGIGHETPQASAHQMTACDAPQKCWRAPARKPADVTQARLMSRSTMMLTINATTA
jgi:hypothetical protein